MKPYESWGRFPKVKHAGVRRLFWRHEPLAVKDGPGVLPYGFGRSYGDSCLNEGGFLLDTTGLNRLIGFDRETGLLRCEAGVSLAQILEVMVPRGWFLPVTPGTKMVSLGGAIANDVHGKNHHRAGTFGCHVTCFELLRSDGGRHLCSPEENADLFRATIAGLGLTGLITWAEFKLKPIANPFIAMESIRFGNLAEFYRLTADSDADYEYTVAWVDSTAPEEETGRGLFMRGNHAPAAPHSHLRPRRNPAQPLEMPGWLLNRRTIAAFNRLYYRRQREARVAEIVPYEPFFYPLDSLANWNRLYGRGGFLQYQCVIPLGAGQGAVQEILERSARSGLTSFLTVLKAFGDQPSPGLLSFPRPGVTLAMDYRYQGETTLRALESLDEVVRQSGGCVYPAKDARMSAASFRAFFPQWRDFARYVDPCFSSSFWRRVTQT